MRVGQRFSRRIGRSQEALLHFRKARRIARHQIDLDIDLDSRMPA
jgi:hypothetical protein